MLATWFLCTVPGVRQNECEKMVCVAQRNPKRILRSKSQRVFMVVDSGGPRLGVIRIPSELTGRCVTKIVIV